MWEQGPEFTHTQKKKKKEKKKKDVCVWNVQVVEYLPNPSTARENIKST
jgi:hypothetical protein